jgi:phosphate transport system substrate-binding protein
VAYRDLNDEERSNCEATNIPTLTINLGKQAAVLLSNAGNDYLACLTTEQIVTAWQASTAGSVQQWNEVSESFPETDLTLFAPDKGSSETDLLLNASSGNGSLVYREDAFFETDPLYRAAATANVDGGLAVLSWPEYQSVLDNNQANVQLVGVDGGSGCVSPSVRTIADGTYPINRQAQLIVNADSLVKPEVQAFIWFVVSNENYTTLETAGFVGVGFGDLPAVRSTLQQAFADAQTRAIAAEATAEATLDATTEVTSDATVEATQDSTAEATLDATAEATAEAGS